MHTGMRRMTRQRSAVERELAREQDFRTAQQIHQDLCTAGHAVGLATVYRTLQALARAGGVDTMRGEDGESMFRQCSTTDHHHHLVCRRCGRTEEIAPALIERWVRDVATQHGYTEVEHSIAIFGLCRQCREEISHSHRSAKESA